MDWITIVTLIVQNAPAAIKTVEDGLVWAQKAWGEVQAAYDQPAETITQQQLLDQLGRIAANSAIIQGL